MRIIGCDLHARQQAVAMLDTETGEAVNLMLRFFSQLPLRVLEASKPPEAELRSAARRLMTHPGVGQ